ncbi:hypothetical protein CV83915_2p0184 (plasmid) [Escherichia coli]|uniref:Transposase n=1 Tax=Escherichia coli TaxID=562 RepID=A0A2H4TKW7_ECOLX|nr:hypothetical protein CV83915_2p0184 [Escherichia coli]
MIWQPEFTDKTLSRKPGAVQYQFLSSLCLLFNQTGVITDAVKTFPHPDSHSDRPFVSCSGPVGCRKRLHARRLLTGALLRQVKLRKPLLWVAWIHIKICTLPLS